MLSAPGRSDVRDARNILVLALLGACGLYLLARTQRGQSLAADAVGGVVSAARNLTIPRGIRNNNPGNIEYIADPARAWRGQIGRDGRFAIFDTPENGVRAIGGELRASIRKMQTLYQAIAEWAPPHENDTDAYAAAFAKAIGAPVHARLTLAMVPKGTAGIILHENGQQPYSTADIARWVNS